MAGDIISFWILLSCSISYPLPCSLSVSTFPNQLISRPIASYIWPGWLVWEGKDRGRERQSVVNLSFSFRTPSTSSYLLPGLMVRYGERRQKTTNHGNENSSLISLLEFSFPWLVFVGLLLLPGPWDQHYLPVPGSLVFVLRGGKGMLVGQGQERHT